MAFGGPLLHEIGQEWVLVSGRIQGEPPSIEQDFATLKLGLCVGERASTSPIASPNLGNAAVKPEAGQRRPVKLGRYVVIEALGRGGMGVVYLAYDPHLARKIAIKVIRLALEDSTLNDSRNWGHERDRVVQEARALAQLSHANVVPIFDVGVQDDDLYLAMECIAGKTLRKWLNQTKRPTWREIIRVMLDLARGLAAVHAVGLVHRDIKPDNALITPQGKVVLIDFGLATQVHLPVAQSGATLGPLTVAGRIEGTPSYMAPEQHLGGEVTKAADVFAFCVALYEALAGIRPFHAANVDGFIRQIRTGRLPSPRHAFPAWLLPILRQGLAFATTDRFTDLQQVIAAIEAGLARHRQRWYASAAVTGLTIAATWLSWVGIVATPTLTHPLMIRVADLQAPQRLAKAGEGLAATRSENVVETWPVLEKMLIERNAGLANAIDPQIQGDMSTWPVAVIQCLTERVAETESYLDLLAHADERIARQALAGAAALENPESCRDTRLNVALPLPLDPAIREQVNEARVDLHRVRVLVASGGFEGANAIASALLKRAQAIGFFPLLAEVHRELGLLNIHWLRGNIAHEHLQRAVLYAQAGSHDRVVAFGASFLLFVDLYLLGSAESPTERLDEGWAWLQRAGHPARASAEWHRIRGIVSVGAGQREACLPDVSKAMLEEWRDPVPDLPMRVTRLSDIGQCLTESEKLAQAHTAFASALSYGENTLGKEHPALFLPTINLSLLALAQMRFVEAKHWLEQAQRVIANARERDPRFFWLCSVRTELALSTLNLDRTIFEGEGCTTASDRDMLGSHFFLSIFDSTLAAGRAWRGEVELARQHVSAALAEINSRQDSSDGVTFSGQAARAWLKVALLLGDRKVMDGLAVHFHPNPNVPADYLIVADLALARGNPGAAADFATQALHLLDERADLGYGPLAWALSQLRLARAHARMHFEEQAQSDFRQAIVVIEQELGEESGLLIEPLIELAGIVEESSAERAGLIRRAKEIAVLREVDRDVGWEGLLAPGDLRNTSR